MTTQDSDKLMLNNVPVRSLVHNNLTIEVLARRSNVLEDSELKLGFDLGSQPWSFMGTGTWFVSHASGPRGSGLFVARRRMMVDP
jgi:ribonuclease Z